MCEVYLQNDFDTFSYLQITRNQPVTGSVSSINTLEVSKDLYQFQDQRLFRMDVLAMTTSPLQGGHVQEDLHP
jgi:hypothetical protein